MLPSQSGNLNGKSSEKFVAKRTLGSILRLGCHPSGAAFAVLLIMVAQPMPSLLLL